MLQGRERVVEFLVDRFVLGGGFGFFDVSLCRSHGILDGFDEAVVLIGEFFEMVEFTEGDRFELSVPSFVHGFTDFIDRARDAMAEEEAEQESDQHEEDLHHDQPEDNFLAAFLDDRDLRTVRVGAHVAVEPLVELEDEHRVDDAEGRDPGHHVEREAKLEGLIDQHDPATKLTHRSIVYDSSGLKKRIKWIWLGAS